MRYLTPEQVSDAIDFASVDVSFISLTLVLPVAYRFLAESGEMVCLIKPQFEAGREKVGKKGVVRDHAVHREVIEKICAFAANNGFAILHITFSPIKGPEGNIEYLLHLRKMAQNRLFEAIDIAALVTQSHQELNGGETI